MNPFLNPIVLFIVPVAAIGIALGVMAAGVKKGTNIFKTQVVAWAITCVMVVCAIGIGYAKAPFNNPRPESVPAPTKPPAGSVAPPASIDSFVWDNARVLSAQTVRTLDARNDKLWEHHQVSIGVVTCDYGGDDLYNYALQCAEDMGLGGYDMIVVLDILGDNYWLLQGNDIRRDFSDQTASDYAYDYMESSFARGDYDDAVLELTKALEEWYGVSYF